MNYDQGQQESCNFKQKDNEVILFKENNEKDGEVIASTNRRMIK